MTSRISLTIFLLLASAFSGRSVQSNTPPPVALIAVKSDRIFNVTPSEHLPYDEILPVIQDKLAAALRARGFDEPKPENPGSSVRLELLQVMQSMTLGSTLHLDLSLRVSIDGTDLSKVFQAGSHRRKLTGINGKGWKSFIDQRLTEATEMLVQNIVGDPEFIKLISTN
jgi:hypothetical protein